MSERKRAARADSPSSAPSPTRSGTLRWEDLDAVLGKGPRKSPTRSGTLRYGDLAGAVGEAPPSSGKSPTRSGTLRWGSGMVPVVPAPPILAPPVPSPSDTLSRIASMDEEETPSGPFRDDDLLDDPPSEPPSRDRLDDLSLEQILAPLLSAGLVRRGGKPILRPRGGDPRREPSDPPAPSSKDGSARDLASAIYDALADEDD
jgi:hypothetical protein